MNSTLDDLSDRLADLASNAPTSMPLTRVTARVATRRRRRAVARGGVALIAVTILFGTVAAVRARSNEHGGPESAATATTSGETTVAAAPRDFHLAILQGGWSLTSVEETSRQVRTTYRSGVGDDATGGPSVSISTGALEPIDRSINGLTSASDAEVDGRHAVMLRNPDRPGLTFVVVDLDGGRSSLITVELADDQVPAILSDIRVIDQNALDSLAAEAGVGVQHTSEDPPTEVSTGG